MNPAVDTDRYAEVTVNVAEAAEQAKKDINFLAVLTDPYAFIFNFPVFYLTLFQLLTGFEKRVERFAIGIPRGFAKTTFLKLLCVWYILFSNKRFILIVCASEKKAINILSDICDLLSSGGVKALFGNWEARLETDQAATKVFTFRGREIVLWAAGAGSSVRGINRKNSRPDVIIMDDIQEREDAKNEELAKELMTWLLSTLMKTRSNFGCTYIYVGNMYPQNCILAKLKEMPQWTSFIVGGILDDGTSLWEDLKPVDELLEEFEMDTAAGHPEVFISEVLNSTDITLASGIDISAIKHLPDYYKNIQGEGSYVLIDPSSGKKDRDDCTINHFEVIDGKSVMDEVLFGTFTPLEVIEKSIELCIRRNTRLICVEDVAYQSTLLFWFNHYCNREGITGFEFQPVTPKGRAKNNRIKAGLIRLIKGEVFLHPAVRSLVISQIQSWNPLKTNNKDDIIDPIGYCDEVEREYGHLMIRQILEIEDYSNIQAAHTEALQLPF